MKILNIMHDIHDTKVNNIAEWNLIHDILNPSKRTKNTNSNYPPILHGYLNTCQGKAKFNSFVILLDIGCSFTILMRRLITKLNPEGDVEVK